MDLLNETVLLKTKSTLFNLLMRETSQFLCYERLLNMTYMAYKNAFSRKMQFWSNCYTVVSYQAPFRLSVYKIPAVYLAGAKNVCFCTIRDFGSPTIEFGSLSPEPLTCICDFIDTFKNLSTSKCDLLTPFFQNHTRNIYYVPLIIIMITNLLLVYYVHESINPYKPSVLFVGHQQTVLNDAYGQVLHCLLTECSINILIKMKNTILHPLKWK